MAAIPTAKPIVPRRHAEEPAQEMTPPMEQRIRIRAYELYEERHGEPGDPVTDWLQAEAEIAGKQTEISK